MPAREREREKHPTFRTPLCGVGGDQVKAEIEKYRSAAEENKDILVAVADGSIVT